MQWEAVSFWPDAGDAVVPFTGSPRAQSCCPWLFPRTSPSVTLHSGQLRGRRGLADGKRFGNRATEEVTRPSSVRGCAVPFPAAWEAGTRL